MNLTAFLAVLRGNISYSPDLFRVGPLACDKGHIACGQVRCLPHRLGKIIGVLDDQGHACRAARFTQCGAAIRIHAGAVHLKTENVFAFSFYDRLKVFRNLLKFARRQREYEVKAEMGNFVRQGAQVLIRGCKMNYADADAPDGRKYAGLIIPAASA